MNRQTTLLPSSNVGSRRTQFALRFIQALTRIKTDATSRISSNMGALHQQRGRVIKIAADLSMASTVGSRRLWSRAVLFKIKNRARLHALQKNKNKNKQRRVGTNDHGSRFNGGLSRGGELRRLVPGGEAMDFCKLLEETAHYIKCLNTQVEVMQSIVDISKTS